MSETTENPELLTEESPVDQIRKAAAAKFTQEEIDSFINMGKQMASKAVLTALTYVIQDGPSLSLSTSECNKLVKKIKTKMPYNYAGYVQQKFKETPHVLHISLSIVERDYVASIDVPTDEYEKEIYNKYGFLKETAKAYWKQFVEENPELYQRILNYRADVDFTELVVDAQSPTTMYLDPKCSKRIGIFPYYINADTGQPFYKKQPRK
jgi:hypothetical protein